jgi:hypothetical protein
MDPNIPKCPRCQGGGHVTLVSEEEDKAGSFASQAHKRMSQMFQCTCGWTIVRTKPPADEPSHK